MSAASSLSAPAVRRSPLAARHRALGARWISEFAEWPQAYAGPQPDRSALRSMLWLADWGPVDKFLLRGERPSTRSPGPQFTPGAIGAGMQGGRPAQLWGLTDREALLLAPAADAAASRALRAELDAQGIAFEDQSSQFVLLRLGGVAARTILEGLLPDDVSDAALPDRTVSFGMLAGVRVTIGRSDQAGGLAFTIVAERDYAEYLWDALIHAGRGPLKVTPVGAAAAEEA